MKSLYIHNYLIKVTPAGNSYSKSTLKIEILTLIIIYGAPAIPSQQLT